MLGRSDAIATRPDDYGRDAAGPDKPLRRLGPTTLDTLSRLLFSRMAAFGTNAPRQVIEFNVRPQRARLLGDSSASRCTAQFEAVRASLAGTGVLAGQVCCLGIIR
jgi:hypothetical protein